MSRKNASYQLIIEWSPTWVRVHSVGFGAPQEAATLSQISDLNGKIAVVAIARSKTLHRVIDLPDSSKSDAMMALRQRLGDLFPIPAAQLAYDIIRTDELSEFGRKHHVFAVRTSDIETLIAEFESAGVTVNQIIPAALLAETAAGQQGLREAILVERFGEDANVDVITRGMLQSSRQIPVAEALTAVNQVRSLATEGAVVAETGLRLDLATQQLAGTHGSQLTADRAFPVDLEPETYRTKREEGARRKRHTQSYLVGAAGLVISLYTATMYLDNADAESKMQAKLKKHVKTLEERTNRVTTDLAKFQKPYAQLKRGFEPAQKFTDILAVVSTLVPKGVWLSGVNLERGKTLQLRGTAKNAEQVNDYLASLTKQQRLRDVRLVFLTTGEIEDQPVVQFSISAFPIGNLPTIEVGKAKK
jgi:Tfp pilus assembly protein PilN